MLRSLYLATLISPSGGPRSQGSRRRWPRRCASTRAAGLAPAGVARALATHRHRTCRQGRSACARLSGRRAFAPPARGRHALPGAAALGGRDGALRHRAASPHAALGSALAPTLPVELRAIVFHVARPAITGGLALTTAGVLCAELLRRSVPCAARNPPSVIPGAIEVTYPPDLRTRDLRLRCA